MVYCTLIERDEMLSLKNYVKGKMTTILSRVVESMTLQLAESKSRRLPDSPMTFRLSESRSRCLNIFLKTLRLGESEKRRLPGPRLGESESRQLGKLETHCAESGSRCSKFFKFIIDFLNFKRLGHRPGL
jgi:hypothetical protein